MVTYSCESGRSLANSAEHYDLDVIQPTEPRVRLFPYQRVFLRACMRYKTIYITAARATSKTFLSILAKYLQCIFVPGHKCFIVAPNKNQAAKISRQKIEEIWRDWPLLEKEVEKANFGKDYVELFFKNGSHFSIVGANLLPSPIVIYG